MVSNIKKGVGASQWPEHWAIDAMKRDTHEEKLTYMLGIFATDLARQVQAASKAWSILFAHVDDAHAGVAVEKYAYP